MDSTAEPQMHGALTDQRQQEGHEGKARAATGPFGELPAHRRRGETSSTECGIAYGSPHCYCYPPCMLSQGLTCAELPLMHARAVHLFRHHSSDHEGQRRRLVQQIGCLALDACLSKEHQAKQ